MDAKQIVLSVSIAVIVSLGMYGVLNMFSSPLNQEDSSMSGHVHETGILRCAYILYPPYFDMDLNTGTPHGVMVDVMEEIGKSLDITIEWSEEVGWGSMIEGLKTGRYDALCSSVWKNPMRAKEADFSLPFGYATVEAWVRHDDDRFIHDVKHFNRPDIRLSTMDGEMSDKLAQDLFPEAQRVSLPQTAPFSDLLLNVVTGKADVAFVEPKVAHDFLKSYPNSLKNVTQDRAVALFPISVMVRQGDVKLKSMLDAALEEILYTQKMDKILAKYQNEGGALFHKPARPY